VRIQTLITAGLVSLLGCSQARTLEGEARRTSWDEVGPLLAANCASCHSGSAAEAGYRTTSYLEALGPTAAPVVVAGDASSKLLTLIDPAKSKGVHLAATSADLFATVSSWVVEGRLSFKSVGPHAGGILNPNDAQEFHGALLSDHNWDLAYCAKCHGADFTGGQSKVACTTCHGSATTAAPVASSCNSCHGFPPVSGSHTAHLSGAQALKLDCTACHIKPNAWSDPNHLGTKAVVKFDAQASNGVAGTPAFDGVGCSNIYCHGASFTDAKAARVSPAWGVAASGSCGSCHGLPPASHAPSSTDCSKCHWMVVSAGQVISNAALHINGKVDVADGTGSCTACHGTPGAGNAAPPRDLAGNTDTSVITVGAHQAHLLAPHNISGPVACSACHLVPAAVGSPGHIDHDGPGAQMNFAGIAVANNATPVWNRDTASCSATYCHGGGTKLGADTTPTLNRTPKWTGGVEQISCGSCHGVPPADVNHKATMQLSDCYTCHPGSVDKLGNIVVSGPPGARVSTHINGVVDVITP
jgi:predicted CxxxxCH...CXXCH cytochrome family protein